VAAAAVFVFFLHATARTPPAQNPAAPPAGAQIVQDAGYPELRVDGVPFFIHAAQFDYFRIPRDLWSSSLDRYRGLGINTIDLRIPWNWHQPRDGAFDFDGRTNPRRDLRFLLQLIAEKRMKLIARPGPVFGEHWPNAGLPSWLLARQTYTQNSSAAELALPDPESALRILLTDEKNMTYARQWLTAVARELAPYGSRRLVRVTDTGKRWDEPVEKMIGGPLLFVALNDATAMRTGTGEPALRHALAEVREALEAGGLDAIYFLSVPDVASRGVQTFLAGSANGTAPPAVAGQWSFNPAMAWTDASRIQEYASGVYDGPLLTETDATSLAFLTSSLSAQPDFPPFLASFSTTTFTPAHDVGALQPSPENTLVASRILLGSGLRGIEYAPLQDTLTPAGWEIPTEARYFRWDAALDLAGNPEPRAAGVMRNGQLLSAWGAMLAASHLRVDFGIVDWRACLASGFAGQTAAPGLARSLKEISEVALTAGFTPELVNPDAQSAERLLRDNVIVLPALEEAGRRLLLSDAAQTHLVEFVKRGGVLIYFPERPPGALLEPLWQSAPATSPAGRGVEEWAVAGGRVIASSNRFSASFYGQNREEGRLPPEDSAAAQSLTELLARARRPRILRRSQNENAGTRLLVTQIISNQAGTRPTDFPKCVADQLCAATLVSVTNLSPDQPAAERLDLLDPRPAVSGAVPATLALDVTVPARESLLLPVHAPLCAEASAGERCTDEVVAAGAELLGAQRDGTTLELTFFAPSNAEVRVRLERPPSRIELDDNIRLQGSWDEKTNELTVRLLRGAAPGYRRTLEMRLRYTPHAVQKPGPSSERRRYFQYQVFDAIRLPLAGDTSLPSNPPLVPANPRDGGHLVISAWNHSNSDRGIDFELDGPFHGSGSVRIFPDRLQFTRIRFQPERNASEENSPATSSNSGLLSGQLQIRSGHDRASSTILYLLARENENRHYQYDFDRDGSNEWVLESSLLRVIVSPADGGRALALVDKSSNTNLITLGGALRDRVVPASDVHDPMHEAGLLTPIRRYRAAWLEGPQGTALVEEDFDRERAGVTSHVEKTLRLAAPQTLEATYRISLESPLSGSSQGAEPSQAFLSFLSVPVAVTRDATTRFCWGREGSPARELMPADASRSAPAAHCEEFVPGGESIAVPSDVRHLEIVTQGRPILVVDWTPGTATIVPRIFSAQIEFAFADPAPGEAPLEHRLRYTVLPGP
jgi:Glycosyl hydrolases family 35